MSTTERDEAPTPGTTPSDGAVTTVVRRRVRPGRELEYEAWLHRLVAEAGRLPGFLGSDIHPPGAGQQPATYVSVFRYDSLENLRRFETSDLRRRYLAEVEPMALDDPTWDTRSGLEMWFAPPPGTVVAQPVRWRMAVVLAVVVYALVLALGALAQVLIGSWPYPLRLAAIVAAQIALVTWVVLPPLTRLLARWIYPKTVTT